MLGVNSCNLIINYNLEAFDNVMPVNKSSAEISDTTNILFTLFGSYHDSGANNVSLARLLFKSIAFSLSIGAL